MLESRTKDGLDGQVGSVELQWSIAIDDDASLGLLLVLLLGLLTRGRLLRLAMLLLVDDQTCPALVLVPLEASEVRVLQLIIGLYPSVSFTNKNQYRV
jgi:hypothetical protein